MGRLYQDSGSGIADRIREAKDIVITKQLISRTDEMTPSEAKFVEEMFGMLDNEEFGDEPAITPKRLFWLRDLHSKYNI